MQVSTYILQTSVGNQCVRDSSFTSVFDCPDECMFDESVLDTEVCQAVKERLQGRDQLDSTCDNRPPCNATVAEGADQGEQLMQSHCKMMLSEVGSKTFKCL